MARALIAGLLRAGVAPANVRVGEPVAEQRATLVQEFGVAVTAEHPADRVPSHAEPPRRPDDADGDLPAVCYEQGLEHGYIRNRPNCARGGIGWHDVGSAAPPGGGVAGGGGENFWPR